MSVLDPRTQPAKRPAQDSAAPRVESTVPVSRDPYLALKYATAVIANAADAIEPAAEAILQRVCAEAGFRCARGYLHLAGVDQNQASVWLAHYADSGDTHSEALSGGPPAQSLAAEALAAGQPLSWHRLPAAALDDALRAEDARSGCAVPVIQHGVMIGALAFYSSGSREADAGLLEALSEVAELLGQVVGRVRAQMRALRQQAELARMSRIASMREVAGSLAHEVNQPLAAIVNYCGGAQHLIEQGRAEQDKLVRVLEHVRTQAKRASGIISDLRELLRKSDGTQGRLDINQLIRRSVDLLEAVARDEGVSIETRLARQLPEVIGDDIQLQQVLINLVLNGIEAMSTPGHKPREILISSHADEQVEITVRDSGRGMHDDLLPKLFTPFFTTKAHGLGIGLSISRSIVEFHGGRLSGENNPGGGMSFHLRLPLAD